LLEGRAIHLGVTNACGFVDGGDLFLGFSRLGGLRACEFGERSFLGVRARRRNMPQVLGVGLHVVFVEGLVFQHRDDRLGN
jgi:hypothetical protein